MSVPTRHCGDAPLSRAVLRRTWWARTIQPLPDLTSTATEGENADMRRLRILTIIPLVAGLLFAGAATTAAQSGAPVIPSVPGMGDLPFVDAGFP